MVKYLEKYNVWENVLGTYVEFGALDGNWLANTYLFDKFFGWKGLCIEPNPIQYALLQQSERTCIKLNLGVAAEPVRCC